MSKWNKESFYEAIVEVPWSGCWVWNMNIRGRANGGHGALGLLNLAEARRMRTEGCTNQQIGDHFGFHHKSISRALKGGRYKGELP